jgi:Protein of unknown function (DUF3574)
MRFVVLIVALPALIACVSPQPLVCQASAKPGVVAELFLGRNIGERLGVSDTAFRGFLDQEVTPRFPDGFSVVDAKGQYRDQEKSAITREPSKVLVIAIPDGSASDPRLAAIADAYKARFKQQSVLTTVRAACVGF